MYNDISLKYSKFLSYIVSNKAISFNKVTLFFSKLFSIVSTFFSILLYLAIIVLISFLALLNNLKIPFFDVPIEELNDLISPTKLASNSPVSPISFVLTSSNMLSEKALILF